VRGDRIWSGWDGLVDPTDEADDDIATTWHALSESLAEHDEGALESFAAQGESLTVDQVSAAMSRLTRGASVMPVLTASALRGWGVYPVLRALRDWLPEAGVSDAPARTRVFKVVHTHERGLVSYARVTGNRPLRIGDKVGGAKVQRILEVQADEWSEVKELAPGDIGALVGAVHGSASEDVSFAPPVYQVCLEVESDREERALEEALAHLVVEDPTAAFGRSDQHELLLRGQGELHVETLVYRLRTHYRAKTVEATRPTITYRATTTVPTTKTHDCSYRVGSNGTQCSMTLRISVAPAETAGPVTVRVRSSGSKGVRDALSAGVLAGAASGLLSGFSLQSTDVTIELTNAALSGTNDDLPHLRAAAARCLLDTAREAGPQLLEPVMSVAIELSTPEHFGTVLSDLTGSRRAIIQSVNPAAGACVALVPAEELLGYASRLRSISSGAGSFTSSLAGYEPVPPEIQQRVLLDRGVVQVE
jgi:elongation factor G